jgi:signal transduction histidine kinase
MTPATGREPGQGHLHPAPAPVLWALGVAGVAAASVAVALAVTGDDLQRPVLQAVLINWIVLPYTLSGIVAWWRRPDSRLGPLMVAVGLATALSSLQWAESPLLFTAGHLVDMLPPVLILHVFLAYPTGLLQTRSERLVVVTGYFVALLPQVAKELLGVQPGSLLSVVEAAALGTAIEQGQLLTISVLLVVGVVLLASRRRRIGRPRRRPVGLLTDAFALGLVMLALLFVAGARGWASFEIIRHLTFLVLGLAPLAFLAGLLDARLARGDVGGLLVELQKDGVPDLSPSLARALHDPSVQVAYWLPEFDCWADQDGRPTTLPSSGGPRAARVIYSAGAPVAALVFHSSLEDERELLEAVVAAAAIALENGRLHAELRARLDELQGSRTRVLEAERRERRRLERDLHDGAQQRLVALTLELGLLERGLESDPATVARLALVRQELAVALTELRDVARGLHPAVLTGHGLAVALESLVARSPVPVRLAVHVEGRLGEATEVAAYYVVCESLTNVAKHAGADSIDVALASGGGWVTVRVVDDGAGGADPEGGSGLRGLADRVEALGGRLRVWSPAGGGTRLEAEIPCR